jgi:hypothetical protein
MRAGHSDTRERRRFTSAVASALVAGVLLAAGIAAGVPAQATVIDGLTLTSTISDQGIATPGSPLTVTVHLANDSGDDVAATSVSVTAIEVDVSTVAGLEDWLATSTGARGTTLGSRDIAVLPDGGKVSVPVSLDVGLAGWNGVWGARALLITVDGEAGALARQHAAILYTGGQAPAVASLAVVVPVVAPQEPGQLIDSASLERLASPGGFLSELAVQTSNTFATLAIDPRIPVSVLAGGNAGSRALEWWQGLVADSPDSFLTAYGDADLAGQIQAGAPQLLSSGSRDGSQDLEAALRAVAPVASPAPSDATLPSPSPSAAPAADPTPRGGWTPTNQGIAWPVSNSVDDAALAAISKTGSSTVLLSSGNVGNGLGSLVSARVGGMGALVVNDGISGALDRAAAATTTEEWNGAMASAVVRLSALVTDPSVQRGAIAALSRSGDAAALTRLNTTLTALQSLPWIQPQGLSGVALVPPVDAELVPRSESPERLAAIGELLRTNDAVTTFASIASEPSVVTDPSARQVMATLAAGLVGEDAWPGRVTESLAKMSDVLASVRVSTDSTINMIGTTATIPVAIENGLATPVTVVVTADPRNNSISIEGPVTVKIESRAQAVARFSAEAQVSNGSVLVDTWLSSESGEPVGSLRSLRVNVRADWEAVGLIAFGAVFVGLVVAGVIRTVRRRKAQGA